MNLCVCQVSGLTWQSVIVRMPVGESQSVPIFRHSLFLACQKSENWSEQICDVHHLKVWAQLVPPLHCCIRSAETIGKTRDRLWGHPPPPSKSSWVLHRLHSVPNAYVGLFTLQEGSLGLSNTTSTDTYTDTSPTGCCCTEQPKPASHSRLSPPQTWPCHTKHTHTAPSSRQLTFHLEVQQL